MTKTERGEKWDKEFISCKHHPDRRCSRSDYIRRSRRCGTCKTYKKLNGEYRPAKIRWDSSEQRRWRDRSNRLAKKIRESRV